MIRVFSTADYRGIVDIYNAIYPELPTTVEEYFNSDEKRDPKYRFCRWVAEAERNIVGFGQYTQRPDKYHPQKFFLSGGVLPDCRKKGIGTSLYNRVIDDLRQYNPMVLCAHARADRQLSVRFVEKRSFREYRREGDSFLDPHDFDSTPYSEVEKRLNSHGIEIMTLRELVNDPDRDRKLYDLDWEVTRDEPGSADDTRVDIETFVKNGLNAQHRLPDGYFVAVRGDEYIGLCLLNHVTADNSVMHGITGVKRAFRRRGIALIMKVRAIIYARENGFSLVRTGNEIGNQPMLAINKRLGFIRQPDWIFFQKTISCSGAS